ncbi:unnamed protein product [Prorocentrum cordatum]|uniref:Uncharacterized protein n=1 Tax=Prorocentrum cordatum TaxID=2364126 RepID=A0ABN9URF8_9DINO|nr:unnamed protein product [Polarella glacialis]
MAPALTKRKAALRAGCAALGLWRASSAFAPSLGGTPTRESKLEDVPDDLGALSKAKDCAPGAFLTRGRLDALGLFVTGGAGSDGVPAAHGRGLDCGINALRRATVAITGMAFQNGVAGTTWPEMWLFQARGNEPGCPVTSAGARLAFRMTKAGVSNSSYTLCEGEDGGLVWGNNGVYVLDPAFKPGMSAVTWLRASRKGEVAFTWTYVGPAPGEEEEAEAPGGATAKGKSKGKAKGEAKGEAKGKAKGEAKGWAKGEAKGWAKGEAKGWGKGEGTSTSLRQLVARRQGGQGAVVGGQGAGKAHRPWRQERLHVGGVQGPLLGPWPECDQLQGLVGQHGGRARPGGARLAQPGPRRRRRGGAREARRRGRQGVHVGGAAIVLRVRIHQEGVGALLGSPRPRPLCRRSAPAAATPRHGRAPRLPSHS